MKGKLHRYKNIFADKGIKTYLDTLDPILITPID
jgi:hypothetical protein